MASDPEFQTRGRLVRSLGRWREMLPGSFVERRRKCGRSYCRCADGKPEHMHPQFLLSVLWQGKPTTFHIPASLAHDARQWVEFHRRFQQAADAICEINLRRLLQRKQEGKEPEKG